ncbi:MAG: branched-chain amino acid--2-keto-4-methylthiobutyrate aminotransferase [Rhodobacteraceae bacterium]|nr:branched-chain amino acid--2-keto-4-methylthiobutyrate aminotransferase [Paracoccaceae bacterium]
MTDWAKGAAWMAGEIVPVAEAKIGVTDWGLTHSDVIYDVVTTHKGGFFRLEDHLERFEVSMVSGRFDVGMDRAAMSDALTSMVARSGLRDTYCSMVAARGVPMIPGSRDPLECVCHFYAWVVPYVHVIRPEIVAQGASVWVAKDVRRIPADCVNSRAKNYQWGDFTAGLFEAKEAGFETVVLLDHAGNVTEGPGFNLFAVSGGKVVTADLGVLEGITRRTVLQICAEIGVAAEVRALPVAELMQADEVFLSSSGGGVLPIVRVDDRIYGNGVPGPVAERLSALYWDWTRRAALRTEIPYD